MTRATKTAKAQPAAEELERPRLLRSKGPLSPAETEIVVYAGLKNGQLTETPANLAIRSKSIAHLATDRPALAEAINHRALLADAEGKALADQLMAKTIQFRSAPPADREAAVAGSLELIDAVLADAFRVLLFTDEDKPVIPPMFDGWKTSKPDNRSTPPVITLVRD